MQSKYELTDELTDICILSTDPQLITDVITLLCTTAAPPKKISVSPPDGSSILTLEFPPTRAGFPLQGSQGIC